VTTIPDGTTTHYCRPNRNLSFVGGPTGNALVISQTVESSSMMRNSMTHPCISYHARRNNAHHVLYRGQSKKDVKVYCKTLRWLLGRSARQRTQIQTDDRITSTCIYVADPCSLQHALKLHRSSLVADVDDEFRGRMTEACNKQLQLGIERVTTS
jgi:hypothetical protein